MLHITGSMKTLREELRVANALIMDILGVLGHLKPSDNLSERVGTFVIHMPEFKVLAKDAEGAKQLLRKVCTGEILPEEAFKRFVIGQEEIHILQNMLDSVNLRNAF